MVVVKSKKKSIYFTGNNLIQKRSSFQIELKRGEKMIAKEKGMTVNSAVSLL